MVPRGNRPYGMQVQIAIALALALLLSALAACSSSGTKSGAARTIGADSAAAGEDTVTPAEDNIIAISFKVDPRLTSGVYMGDRWASPSTYDIVAPGTPYDVGIRAEIVDGDGRTLPVTPEWTVDDPEMVTLTPGEDNEVLLTLKRAGQSNLQITAQEVSRTLTIEVVEREGAMRVTIRQ